MTQTTFTVEIDNAEKAYQANNPAEARREARSENPKAVIGTVDKL